MMKIQVSRNDHEAEAAGAGLSPVSNQPVGISQRKHVADITESFKAFASNEKLHAKRSQDSKSQCVRKEWEAKLDELKKFGKNFSLKTEIPDDLVPILAKETQKQMRIQQKAEADSQEIAARTPVPAEGIPDLLGSHLITSHSVANALRTPAQTPDDPRNIHAKLNIETDPAMIAIGPPLEKVGLHEKDGGPSKPEIIVKLPAATISHAQPSPSERRAGERVRTDASNQRAESQSAIRLLAVGPTIPDDDSAAVTLQGNPSKSYTTPACSWSDVAAARPPKQVKRG